MKKPGAQTELPQPIQWPTRRDENWRYTDLSGFANRPFQLAPMPDKKKFEKDEVFQARIQPHIYADNYLVFLNGYLVRSHILSGVEIKTLSKHPITHFRDIFDELNGQYHQEGVQIFLNKDFSHEHLQILYLSDAGNYCWIQPSVEIIVDNHLHNRVIESFVSESPVVVNAKTKITLEKNTKLDYIKIQQEHAETFHVGRTECDLQENAQLKTITISLGAKIARSDIFVKLKAENAVCDLKGLYISRDRQTLDHHTMIEHIAPKTISREFYRGILMDKSRSVFNGKVIVHPHAHKVEAEQYNHNLLLSNDAEIDTQPELEIYHHDVKCSHGATVGQLDEDAIFYLRSRGVDVHAAKKMLIQAFADKILNEVSPITLREKLCLMSLI